MPNQQFYPKATFDISGDNFNNAFNPSPRNYVTTFQPSAYDAILKTVTTATLNFKELGIKVGDVCMVGVDGAAVGNRSIITKVKSNELTLTSNISAAAGKPVIIYQNIPDPGVVLLSGPGHKNDIFILGACNEEDNASETGRIRAVGNYGQNYDCAQPLVPVQVVKVFSSATGSSTPPNNGARLYVAYN